MGAEEKLQNSHEDKTESLQKNTRSDFESEQTLLEQEVSSRVEKMNELREAIQSAQALSGFHEDIESVQELEKLRIEINQIENSFLTRVGKFLTSPRESVKEWKQEQREKALSIPDNQKVIEELYSRAQFVCKKIDKDAKEWNKNSKNTASNFEAVIDQKEFDEIMYLYTHAKKEEKIKWDHLENKIVTMLNYKINPLLKKIKNKELPDNERKDVLSQALQLYSISPDGNSDMAKALWEAIKIMVLQKYEFFTEGLSFERKSDNERAKIIKEKKQKMKEERKILLEGHPDILVYDVLDVNVDFYEKQLSDYATQLGLLKILQNTGNRQSTVTEFKIETYPGTRHAEGLRRDLVEPSVKQGLFEAYSKYDEDKIFDNIEYFQTEVDSLSTERLPGSVFDKRTFWWRAEALFTHNSGVSLEGSFEEKLANLFCYIKIDEENYEDIRRSVGRKINENEYFRLRPDSPEYKAFYEAADKKIQQMLQEEHPLAVLTNPDLFSDHEILQKQILEGLGVYTESEDYSKKLKIFTQLIEHSEKYPFVKKEEIQQLLGSFIEQMLNSFDPEDKKSQTSKGEFCIQFLATVLTEKLLDTTEIENIKQKFFKKFISLGIFVVLEQTHQEWNQEKHKQRSRSTSERIVFFKQFFGIDIENQDTVQTEEALVKKCIADGNPQLWLKIFLLKRRTEYPGFSLDQWPLLADKILQHAESTTLHNFLVLAWPDYEGGRIDFYKQSYFRTPERTNLLVHSLLERGKSEDLKEIMYALRAKAVTFSSAEIDRFKQRILSEGDGETLKQFLGEQWIFESKEERKPAIEPFIERANSKLLAEFFRDLYSRVLLTREQLQTLFDKIRAEGSLEDLCSIVTNRHLEREYRREALEKMFSFLSAEYALRLLKSPEARINFQSNEEIHFCVEKIKKEGDFYHIEQLLQFYHDEQEKEKETSSFDKLQWANEALRIGYSMAEAEEMLKQSEPEALYIPLQITQEELNEFGDLYITRTSNFSLLKKDSSPKIDFTRQIFTSRVLNHLENPKNGVNWNMIRYLPLEFAFAHRVSFQKCDNILKEQGRSPLEQLVSCESESEFSVQWVELLKAIEKMADFRKKLTSPEFNDFTDENKDTTVNTLASAQDLIANKNLRMQLSTAFLEKPSVFDKNMLGRVPKESHASLNLLREQFLLSDEQLEVFAREFFSGQVVKRSTDRDRFNYFLLDGKNTPEPVKGFLEISIPLIQRCADSKKKLFALSQLLRSYGFLEEGYGNRLALANQRLVGFNQEYEWFLEEKKQTWAVPLEKEVQALQEELKADPDSKKIKTKIDKKLSQLARGPEIKDESNWKKEFNPILLEKMDTLIAEYDVELPSLFAKRCGVELTPEEVNRFLEKFKDPALIFIYLGKLQESPKQQKLFQHFIESVAKGKLSEVRYEHREHLDKIFAGDVRLEKLWRMNSRLERKGDGTIESDGGQKETMAKQRIKEFITEALRHNHVEGEYAEILTSYIETDDITRQSMKKDFENKIKNLVDGEDRTRQEKTWIAIVNTMKLLSAKSSELKEGLIKEIKIEELLKQIKNAFSEDSPFQGDVAAISQVVSELKNEKKQIVNTLKDLRAEESEDPDLLLRLGTDVVGSCQNVNGNPSLNRNLISYMMDGKVKTLFVRDGAGDIVSRAIMRILYDETARKPVINLEHSYHRSDAPVTTSNELLFALAQEKATKLGVELVISAKFKANQELPYYEGNLISYGGPGDTEYVDTIGGSHLNQKYTIPGNRIYHVQKNEKDIELDSAQNYTWLSNAA